MQGVGALAGDMHRDAPEGGARPCNPARSGNDQLLAREGARRLDCDLCPIPEKSRRTMLPIIMDLLVRRTPGIEPLEYAPEGHEHNTPRAQPAPRVTRSLPWVRPASTRSKASGRSSKRIVPVAMDSRCGGRQSVAR